MNKTFFGWFLVLVSTLYLVYLQSESAPPAHFYTTLTIIAVIMWTWQLTPAFVPGLFVILVCLLINLVPQSILLSGFNSDVFFLVLSVFALSGLLTASGLTYRCVLWLLYKLPDSPWTTPLVLFSIGALLSPVIPSPLGRSSMVTPLLTAMAANNKHNITPLTIGSIHGSTLLSTIFLTGNPLNFILIGLLDNQTQQRFQWLEWFVTAASLGLILLIGFMLIMMWQLKGVPRVAVNKLELKDKINALGLLSQKEIGAITALISFFIAVITQSIHQVPLVWASLLIALACFMMSGLSSSDFRKQIDWGTLIFIASIVCWGPAMIHIGMDQTIAHWLNLLLNNQSAELWQLLALLIGFIILVRLIFPGAPTFIILISSLLPFASAQGINPWLIGFILLTISEGFIFPHQHGVFEQTIAELKNSGYGDHINFSSIITTNIMLMILRIIAIFACIPIWHQMAII